MTLPVASATPSAHPTAPVLTPESPLADFSFDRWPVLTLLTVGLLIGVYYGWQGGAPGSADDLARLGAKNLTLMLERGEWWRLVTGNLLHASIWHFAVNALFLFNLGGPAESVFRRLDYLLILVGAALGTTLVSAGVGAATSCGASGIVFGVWGALAVFGLRHRAELPARYQRYFLGSVLPYAALAFYVGSKTPGADTWGHLGGLGIGVLLGLVLPPRLLTPRLVHARLKTGALAAVGLAIAGLSVFGPGVRGSVSMSPTKVAALEVPVPTRWRLALAREDTRRQTFLYENGAGVSLAITAQALERLPEITELVRQFVDHELAPYLEATGAIATRIEGLPPVQLDGLTAERLEVETAQEGFHDTARFVILLVDEREYVINMSAPTWLFASYAPTFERMAAGVRRSRAR
jgi:membrane associated rhomboid family serine protease